MPASRKQLLLPFLSAVSEAGGTIASRAAYDDIARRVGLTQAERDARTAPDRNGATYNQFERDVRWTRQTAIRKGFLKAPERGVWALTDIGNDRLSNASEGLLVTVFETPGGQALWGMLETAVGAFDDQAIDLLFTSPPYPGALKTYINGDLDEENWVSFMMDMINGFAPKMSSTGSMMLNVAETYVPGLPVKQEHLTKLRMRLASETRFRVLDTLYWHNSSRLASPFEWVAKRRIRLKPSVEPVLWISENPYAKANNRNVLQDYKRPPSETYHKGGVRPGGHKMSEHGFSRDNGGSIASSLFTAGGSAGSKAYRDGLKRDGLPQHPAIMPEALAQHCIKLATDVGDLVVDPMSGSLTTARACETLKREWVCIDSSLSYLAGARHKFPDRKEDQALIEAVLKREGAFA